MRIPCVPILPFTTRRARRALRAGSAAAIACCVAACWHERNCDSDSTCASTVDAGTALDGSEGVGSYTDASATADVELADALVGKQTHASDAGAPSPLASEGGLQGVSDQDSRADHVEYGQVDAQPAMGGGTCAAPMPPDGGVVVAPSVAVGAVASYVCVAGYVLAGPSTRTCQANGLWSGEAPICNVLACGAPPSPEHGTVNVGPTTYGAIATYACATGYELVGAATSACQPTGTWSPTTPVCSPKDCGPLANLDHGTVELSATTYQGVAHYRCQAGYLLAGAAARTCGADGTWSAAAPECHRPASCQLGNAGAGFDCGPSGTEDCCSSPLVTGGTYSRGNDTAYPATVSDFRLDAYEITVGRFRAFAAAGMGTRANPPAAGSGANPHVAGSGWDPSWNTSLVEAGGLAAAVQCSFEYQTWSGGNDRRPINCISWQEAFAFCIWDGGRLPTELEWNYAAVGGSEQRKYPWGSAEPGANADLTVYGCYYGGTGTCKGFANIAPVGSVPAGNGRWGQADMIGNLWEWNFDGYDGTSRYPVPCINCALFPPAGSEDWRVTLGISYVNTPVYVNEQSYYGGVAGKLRQPTRGARCVRNP